MVVLAYALGAAVEGHRVVHCRRPVHSTGRIVRPVDVVVLSCSRGMSSDFKSRRSSKARPERLSSTIDVLIMSSLTSAAQVGLYHVARQIIGITILPVEAMGYGLQVEYSSRYYASDGAGLRTLARRFTMVSIGLAVIIHGLLALFLGLRHPGAARPRVHWGDLPVDGSHARLICIHERCGAVVPAGRSGLRRGGADRELDGVWRLWL